MQMIFHFQNLIPKNRNNVIIKQSIWQIQSQLNITSSNKIWWDQLSLISKISISSSLFTSNAFVHSVYVLSLLSSVIYSKLNQLRKSLRCLVVSKFSHCCITYLLMYYDCSEFYVLVGSWSREPLCKIYLGLLACTWCFMCRLQLFPINPRMEGHSFWNNLYNFGTFLNKLANLKILYTNSELNFSILTLTVISITAYADCSRVRLLEDWHNWKERERENYDETSLCQLAWLAIW